MKLDDAPSPPPPARRAGMHPPGDQATDPNMHSNMTASKEAEAFPAGHAVPSQTPYDQKTAPPNAQMMRSSNSMQAPLAHPYPAVHTIGVPIMQTSAPATVVMTHQPLPPGRPERNIVPIIVLIVTICIFWPCCPCATAWVVVEEIEYKNKREAWERKVEAERQHDRAFAMQAAHAASGASGGHPQVVGPMPPQGQYQQPQGPYQQPQGPYQQQVAHPY